MTDSSPYPTLTPIESNDDTKTVTTDIEKASRGTDGKKTGHCPAHQDLIFSTQKQPANTKRLLIVVFSCVILLLAMSIFGLAMAMAKLTSSNSKANHAFAPEVAREVEVETVELTNVANSSEVVISTIAEGHLVFPSSEHAEDPYGLAASTGSLFSTPKRYSTDVDNFQCSMDSYLSGAIYLGSVPHCRGIYESAKQSQTISFVSTEESKLRPGQSMTTLSFHPEETWTDPILLSTSDNSASYNFYKETVHMVLGTVAGGQCKLLVFVEETGKSDCPYYEIPECSIPECVANPPVYEPSATKQDPSYPQP